MTIKKNLEKKLKQKIEFEKLVSKISLDFIGIKAKNVNKKINKSLKTVGQFFGAGRCYIFEFKNNQKKMDNTYEWCSPDTSPQKEMLKNLDSKIFPWWMNKLKKSEIIHIPSVNDMPNEASAEREILKAQSIKSAIVIPMFLGKTLFGFIGFDFTKSAKDYSKDMAEMLNIIGNIIVASLRKRDTELKIIHLNSALFTIKDINQLINKEKDKTKLIKGACKKFTEGYKYHNAWIALIDESGKITEAAENGAGKSFQALIERINKGKLTSCWKEAISSSDIIINKNPKKDCSHCPLADSCSGRGAMTVRLEHDKKVYGILSAFIPLEYIEDKETLGLFAEVADDISFALYSLELEEERKKSEKKYRTIFENTGTAAVIIEEDTTISLVNSTFEKISGYSKSEIENKNSWTKFVVKEDLERLKRYHYNRRTGGGSAPTNYESKFVDKSGDARDVSLTISIIPGTKKSIASIIDITKRKKAEEKLEYLSLHDKLTGLYNRYYFESELKRLNTARQIPISIAMGDVNSLKLVNDSFGHKEGDKLLNRAAMCIKGLFRAEDIISRWGGDEFLVILPKTPKKTAEEIISRIKRKCRRTSKDKIPLSISLGVATKEKPGQNINSVIKEAEDNMYRNKLLEKDSIAHSLISSLKKSLFKKGHGTRKRADRLNELSIKLGRACNLTRSELDKLSLLATLRDIGIVAIPKKILEKKEKLTKSDWDIIKKHPVTGSNICKSLPLLVAIANPLLYHHEQWDGNGYPQGIKGHGIPIISRIIAIVDAYDVMTHYRVYKKTLTKDEAIKELKRYSGTQFDPNIVDDFINIIK